MSINESYKRIKWQCRRGMLELDRLLLPFTDNLFMQLEIDEQRLFEHLLTYPDPLLYRWFIGHELPSDKHLAALVEKILQYAQAQTAIEYF